MADQHQARVENKGGDARHRGTTRGLPNVRVKIGDVEIDQHFFVQETSSHPVILGEPYITAARMETKVLDNGSAYARVKSQDGRHSVQCLTVRLNHERNRESLGGENREDF